MGGLFEVQYLRHRKRQPRHLLVEGHNLALDVLRGRDDLHRDGAHLAEQLGLHDIPRNEQVAHLRNMSGLDDVENARAQSRVDFHEIHPRHQPLAWGVTHRHALRHKEQKVVTAPLVAARGAAALNPHQEDDRLDIRVAVLFCTKLSCAGVVHPGMVEPWGSRGRLGVLGNSPGQRRLTLLREPIHPGMVEPWGSRGRLVVLGNSPGQRRLALQREPIAHRGNPPLGVLPWHVHLLLLSEVRLVGTEGVLTVAVALDVRHLRDVVPRRWGTVPVQRRWRQRRWWRR